MALLRDWRQAENASGARECDAESGVLVKIHKMWGYPHVDWLNSLTEEVLWRMGRGDGTCRGVGLYFDTRCSFRERCLIVCPFLSYGSLHNNIYIIFGHN